MAPQPKESQLIPDESQLISQFARGNGTVFVGAGLSVGAGLPGWADLVEPLAQEVRSPEGSSFPDVAQYFVNLKDRPTLVARIKKVLKGRSPTEIHKALIKLPVPRIFTTNFDNLLEAAFDDQHLSYGTIVIDQDLGLMDSTEKSIVKLHGDLGRPESWVLTSEDYDNYFSNHPGIANLLGMDLHSRTVLFLGYSFNDVNLRMILSQVKRVAGRFMKNLFAVQFNPTPLEERELNRRGVRVIGLKAKANQFNRALQEWLEGFSRRVRESPELHPVARQLFPIHFINCNLPPHSGGLLGRTTELARTMEGLRLRYHLIAINGFAGVGKTSLAIEVGHNCCLDHDPSVADPVVYEYVVWVSAKYKPDQKRWLDDVLNAIAITTSNPAITQLPVKASKKKKKERDKEKEEQVRKLLQSYKILIIIDNFDTMDDPELIEWLERLPYPSRAIVTSRSRPEHVAAWTVDLEGLDAPAAITLLRQHAAPIHLEEQTLRDLARVTEGNPQAMKLALGLVQGGLADFEQIIQQLDNPGTGPERIFPELFAGSWEQLSGPAQKILLVTPLFVGVSSIHRAALQAAAGLPDPEFEQGRDQCLRFGLLEDDHVPQRYLVHPLTRAFARDQWVAQPAWEQEARRRWVEYFRELVRERVVRPHPEPPYWNALVSHGMVGLDPEWPSIQQVMAWADASKQDEVLVELVMLLVHYMDSRFLNLERLEYVEKAVAALRRMGRKEEEALLRIDALGWTYVEVLQLEEARQQILRGLEMAQGEDLRALGLAWRARVRVEKRNFKEADEWIEQAMAVKCSAWIRFRVNMAAGDIKLKRGDRESSRAALELYQRAVEETLHYGGEGSGYQIGPRIGLAFLGMGQIEEAERKFKELSGLEQIPIGKLYAEYGLALVARERGYLPEARVMLNDVKAKLSRRTRSNLLLRLIEEQEARMQGSPESRSREAARAPRTVP
ncbi:MAG TPA: SIR2 family protein [Thermoanaerobaculia bacterium]|jgi:LuxR family glucitol operon transcriptional activator|nr:SIR2 family protein [Thermoanaerobaculia bacterium]